MQVNMQSLERVERDIDQLKNQLGNLKERESYLLAQLASMTPTGSASQDRNLLRELKAKLVQLQLKYTDKNSEVIKTKAEIEELEKRLNSEPANQQTGQQKYKVSATDMSENPAYATLASQLAATQTDIEATQKQIQEVTRKRDDYQRRIEASPRVDETFKALMMRETRCRRNTTT